MYVPSLKNLYRRVWDRWALSNPLPTSHGFILAGQPGMTRKSWEMNEIREFLELLKGCSTCIDVGANVGFYSCLAAVNGKHVVAVEPLPRNLRFLCQNLACNDLCDVEIYATALSTRPGLRRLWGKADMASLVAGWGGAPTNDYEFVPVTTLDLIAAERFNGTQLAIKMDVEGSEFDVLKGASRTLTMEPKPIWMIEILLTDAAIPGTMNQNFQDTFKLFWDNGYACYQTLPDRPLVKRSDLNNFRAKDQRGTLSTSFIFTANR